MARFQENRRRHSARGPLITAIVFILVLVMFYEGVVSLSADSRRRQRDSLEAALMRSVAYCYAVEGTYPESLDYLKKNYGLAYDEDRFFVDYRVIGANILPDITIIERGER